MPRRGGRRRGAIHALSQLGRLTPFQVVLFLNRRRRQTPLGRTRRLQLRPGGCFALLRAGPPVQPANRGRDCWRGLEGCHRCGVVCCSVRARLRLSRCPRPPRASKRRRGLPGRLQLAAVHASRRSNCGFPPSCLRLAGARRWPGRRLAWARRKQILRCKHGLARRPATTGPGWRCEAVPVLRGGLPQSLGLKPRTAARRGRSHGLVASAAKLRQASISDGAPTVPSGPAP